MTEPVTKPLELYGSSRCPFTRELRDWLDWKGKDYVEYDVDEDSEALQRLTAITGKRMVPVLLEDGNVIQSGWQGQGCTV